MEFCREKFKENFSATCMMFGVITVGLHYKKIAEKDLNPAMPLIIGPPECGKTRATQLFAGLKEKLIELFTKSGKILNYIFQLECCPTTSKQHWQIYIETSKLRFRTLKALLPKSAHIELARNKQAARMYSMKSSTRISGPWHNLCEGDFQELSKKNQTGASIQEIYKKICEGEIKNVEEVAHQSVGVFLRHERSLTSLISSRQQTEGKSVEDSGCISIRSNGSRKIEIISISSNTTG